MVGLGAGYGLVVFRTQPRLRHLIRGEAVAFGVDRLLEQAARGLKGDYVDREGPASAEYTVAT